MRLLATVLTLVLGLATSLHAESTEEEIHEPFGQLIESFADLNRLDYSNSIAPTLKDLQKWHQATPDDSLRVSWMMMPAPNTQERTTIGLTDGRNHVQHYVYAWAIQGWGTSHVRTERLKAMRAILADMPEGLGMVKDTKDLFVVSFHQDGQVRTVAYRRTDLPVPILRLCLLGKIEVDIAPAGKTPHVKVALPVRKPRTVSTQAKK